MKKTNKYLGSVLSACDIMQLKNLGILLIDFIENDKNTSMEDDFRMLCELKEPNRIPSISLDDIKRISITNYGRIVGITIPSEFEFVELSTIQESPFITDIYCYGILKKEIIEKAESNPQEVRKRINKAQENLENFIKPYINGIFTKDELKDGRGLLPIRFLWINPEDANPFRYQRIEAKLVIDEEYINQWIKNNSFFFTIFGFNSSALMAKENSSIISRMCIWGDFRSGFFLMNFFETKKEYFHPTDFILDNSLIQMLRIHYWCGFRLKQMSLEKIKIKKLYQRLINIKKGKTIVKLPRKLKEVNKVYDEVLEWEVNLLSLLARIKDEIEYFRVNLYNLNVTYNFEKQLNKIKKEFTDISISTESEFNWELLPSFYFLGKENIDGLNGILKLIENRQARLVGYLHDLVNIITALKNLDLQKNIRNLAILSASIALIALIIAILPYF